MILSRRPLYREDLLTHATANLHRCRSVLSCMSSVVFRMRCAAQISRLQGKLSQLAVTDEPAGSFHLVPAIMPPIQPCLYLKVNLEVLPENPQCSAVETMNEVFFFFSVNDQNGRLYHRHDLHRGCVLSEAHLMLHSLRFPTSERYNISYTILSFSVMLSLINGI